MLARTTTPATPATSTPAMTDARAIVDLDRSGTLTIAWDGTPGERPRPIHRDQVACLDALAIATTTAERSREAGRIIAARQALGLALFEQLDGPERGLTRRLEQAAATRRGSLAISIVLRGSPDALAAHPAAAWRWELVADSQGPLALRRGLTLAVQLGDVRSSEPRVLDYGALRILFMAYSPRGTKPVLDYEREEERILAALSNFVQDGRAQLQVVEFGTLPDLGLALRDAEFDVVHLSGHGVLTSEGPRLLMEDERGNPVKVSAAELRRELERARIMPELVMVSSCLSAGEVDDIPSFTAQLVADGVPAAIGWAHTVSDEVATEAAADIYQQLCTGHTPAQAVAFTRARMHEADRAALPAQATHAWGTLHLVTRDAAGFVVDERKPLPPSERVGREETYRSLDQQGRMRVLEKGFVGRRRPLQRLVRILTDGRDDGVRRAGAAIFGNKGTGKSCLAARAIERAQLGDRVVVLHGRLDETLLFQQLEHQALRWDDARAEAHLRDGTHGSVVERLRRLLAGHWSRRRIVFLLDDFEQNLEIRSEGLARLSPFAAALLDVLLPACRTGAAKLLITTTARFELPSGEAEHEPLAWIGLDGLDPGSLRKLWLRGQGGAVAKGELAGFTPGDWAKLCTRLGGNPRILDWARTLLRGKTPRELDTLVADVGELTPHWEPTLPPSAEQQDELARLFLRHMAYDEAIARISADARTFVQRARVYELAVPREGLEGLCEGLAIDLDLHVPALQNLGLLEVGELDDEPASRVSPLCEPAFVAEPSERWHGVAASFWARPQRHRGQTERMLMAWEHALAGRCGATAVELSGRISNSLDRANLHRESIVLARRHLAVFPNTEAGHVWAGYALYRAGDPVGGWREFEKAERAGLESETSEVQRARILDDGARILCSLGRHAEAETRLVRAMAIRERSGENSQGLASTLHELASVLKAQGDLSGARERLERALTIWKKVFGTDEHPDIAASLHSLAGVLQVQGDLSGARELLERSLTISKRVFGTDEHPDVAVTLHSLAGVLQVQGDLSGARERLERSLAISMKLFGTEEHPDVIASFHSLAGVLKAQGDLTGARERLERALTILGKVFSTEEHPDVAASLHSLAGVLKAQGDLTGACERLERTLTILEKVFSTEEHPDVAASLHSLACVFRAQGKLSGARERLERALNIWKKVFGTEEHPSVAASLHELAGVLKAQGDLSGARERLERALTIWKKVFGTEEHPSVAASLHELAGVLKARGDLSGARERLERALTIWTKVFGTDDEHPEVAASLHSLAGVLKAQNDLSGARERLERSLTISKKVFGTDEHPEVAASLHELAGVLQAQGDLSGARERLERSLTIWKKVFGTDEHPSVAASLHSLAGVLVAEGSIDDAVCMYRRVLWIEGKIYGTRDHYVSAETEVALAVLLMLSGQAEEAVPMLLHAMAVFEQHVPGHPSLAQLRQFFGRATP